MNRRSKPGVAAAALIAVVLFAIFGVDSIAHPWAFAWMTPLTGTAPLVGRWYGQLRTPTGRTLRLALDLDAYLGRCRVRRCARLQAVALICDQRGPREYGGSGHVQDWRGNRFDVDLMAKDDLDRGLRVIEMRGGREGDSLRVVAQLRSGHSSASIAVERSGKVTRPADDPDTVSPVSLILRRDGEQTFAAGDCAWSSIR